MVKYKAILILLLAVILILGWRLTDDLTTRRQLQNQVTDLSSNLHDKSALENIELQRNCAEKAGATYLQLGYKNGGIDNYPSHFNPRLNKCFISIYSLDNGAITSESLSDAYEQRVYAQYMWQPQGEKKYWEVPPMLCNLTPSSKERTDCKSEDEYKAFVARYMED